LNAQDRVQVWGDEFNEGTIDRSIWSFDLGPGQPTVSTLILRTAGKRQGGDGTLQIIAQK